jgi:hypothetical protein
MKKIVVFLLPLLVSGCLLETVGPIDRTIKPYGAHWIKDGMTKESRRVDSWACGAAGTAHAADHVVFTPEQRQSVRALADKDDFGPDKRLLDQWRACMRSKGYAYLEQCDGRCLHP